MSHADVMRLSADTQRRIAEYRSRKSVAASAPRRPPAPTAPLAARTPAKPAAPAAVKAKAARRPPPDWVEMRAEHVIWGMVEDNAPQTIAFLDGCAQCGVESAVLRIVDSPGGFVADAYDIRAAILQARRSGVHVTAVVENRCYSSATIVAGGCSYIAALPAARWLIHDSRVDEGGDAIDLDRNARMLRRTDARAMATHAEDSGLPKNQVRLLMIKDRPIKAHDAVRLGFVDAIIEEGQP